MERKIALSRGTQNAVHFRFQRIRSNVSVFVLIALLDYHWTQILCEVEEQATCMPMSPGCLSNSCHLIRPLHKVTIYSKNQTINVAHFSGKGGRLLLCCDETLIP